MAGELLHGLCKQVKPLPTQLPLINVASKRLTVFSSDTTKPDDDTAAHCRSFRAPAQRTRITDNQRLLNTNAKQRA